MRLVLLGVTTPLAPMLTQGHVLCAPISILGRLGYIKAQSWRGGIVMKLFVGLALLPLLAHAITDNNYTVTLGVLATVVV